MRPTYDQIMAMKEDIIKTSLKMDYESYRLSKYAFDYEKMLADQGYTLESIRAIQLANNIGNTPLIELKRLSAYAKKYAPKGYGARIFLKDEACNLSGSFKARRAAISIHHAKKLGFKGVIAATSGNYGAAVAALAARAGLKCIIVQECYDKQGIGQPEIIEKARACQAYGAEVVQLSVGPELFYQFLKLLKETGYFNASLYAPYGVMGIETLGLEIAEQTLAQTGKHPDVVICTNAGGGNLTGTARGLIKAGANHTKIVAASVDLTGLHMASDHDFNLKSFTTGHTGFAVPFSTYPDRADVTFSAARPLRYTDQFVTVNQGSVFFITQALAQLEGMERGPAGNTSLAVAFKMAQEMKQDEIIVVQESEYTGAGKHMSAQLSFAKNRNIKLAFGHPASEKPGQTIVFPASAKDLMYQEVTLDSLRITYLKRYKNQALNQQDIAFFATELKTNEKHIINLLEVIHETKS